MDGKTICPHCHYVVKVCRTCGDIMPPTTHGAVKYCGECRRNSIAEYNRRKQADRRAEVTKWRERLEAVEKQLTFAE